MTVTEAIQYCESHECENCPIYYLANDIRTNYEQKRIALSVCNKSHTI